MYIVIDLGSSLGTVTRIGLYACPVGRYRQVAGSLGTFGSIWPVITAHAHRMCPREKGV